MDERVLSGWRDVAHPPNPDVVRSVITIERGSLAALVDYIDHLLTLLGED